MRVEEKNLRDRCQEVAWYGEVKVHHTILAAGANAISELEQGRDQALAVLGAIVRHLLDDDWVTATQIARHAGREVLADKGGGVADG